MLGLLLLAAAAARAGAEQAERAFAALALRDGQWTAFRAFTAPDALMFVPAKADSRGWLANRPDPPGEMAALRAIASCDGTLAISKGPWLGADAGASGTFTTIWRRQPERGWKWVLDHGRSNPRVTAAGETVTIAGLTCARDDGAAAHPPEGVHLRGARVDPISMRAAFGARDAIVQRDGAMPARTGAGLPRVKISDPIAQGRSDDRSLCWESVAIDGAERGAHNLILDQRRGGPWKIVLYDLIGMQAA